MWRWGLALLLGSDLAPGGGPARADEAAAVSGLDSLLEAEARAGFSGVVLIARGDRVWFERARGTALRAGADAGSTAFWLASCSKQFTATAVLRLRDSGRLRTGGEDWLGHTSVVRFTPAGDLVVVLANSGEKDGVSWATRVNRGLRRLLDP